MTARISPHVDHQGAYKSCRHPACLAYRERYRKRWAYDKSQGRRRMASTAKAAAHIQTLLGSSWSLRAIAGAAETSASVISRIGTGDQKTARIETLRRILAIDPDSIPARPSKQTVEPFVPRVGTVRRIQALLYMGWGHAQMREHCGLNTGALIHQQGRWVTRSTHDKVAAMFRDLAMTPGPSSKARTYARQRGYIGPLGWDDIDNDAEPAAVPDDWRDETPIQTVRRMLAEQAETREIIAALPEISPNSVRALASITRREQAEREAS